MSDVECEDSLLESDVENTARKVIEKAADGATADHSQEPVRWGNPQELTVLENQDCMMTLIKSPLRCKRTTLRSDCVLTSLQQKVELLESDVIALKAATELYFAVRSRFFTVFLRDKIGKSTRVDQELIKERNIAAHGGDPITDAMMF